mgnify:CR=1 FL=1
MEFKDVVYGRRSVRKFKDTPVDDKILKKMQAFLPKKNLSCYFCISCHKNRGVFF